MGGLHRQRGWDKEVKRADYFRQGIFPSEDGRGFYQADLLTKGNQEISDDWFKLPLPGEAETTMRLSIRSWWILAQVTPFWVCCVFF